MAGGGGRLETGSMAVADIVPLQLALSDARFFAYFAGRTQVGGWGGLEVLCGRGGLEDVYVVLPWGRVLLDYLRRRLIFGHK